MAALLYVKLQPCVTYILLCIDKGLRSESISIIIWYEGWICGNEKVFSYLQTYVLKRFKNNVMQETVGDIRMKNRNTGTALL